MTQVLAAPDPVSLQDSTSPPARTPSGGPRGSRSSPRRDRARHSRACHFRRAPAGIASTAGRLAWVALAALLALASPGPGLGAPSGSWMSGLGAPEPDGEIHAFCDHEGQLIVAGDFTLLGRTPVRRIARWDGERWSPLGAGLNGTVRALCTYRGDLIAAGDFTAAGHTPASRIARWDGLAWHPLGEGSERSVLALAVLHDSLFAGRQFGYPLGPAPTAIRKWDGSRWSDAGLEGMPSGEGRVVQLFAFEERLVGWWDNQRPVYDPDDVPYGRQSFAMQRTAGAWRPLPDLYGGSWASALSDLEVMGVFEGKLCAAGYFPGRQGMGHYLVNWTGSEWVDLAPVSSRVTLLLGSWRGHLLVAEDGRLSSWNGRELSPLTVVGHRPQALFSWRGDLWSAGRRQSAPDLSMPAFSRWDGSTWSAIGVPTGAGLSGTSDPAVLALTILDGSLVLAGTFDRVGDLRRDRLTARTGQTWQRYPHVWTVELRPATAGCLRTDPPWIFVPTYTRYYGEGYSLRQIDPTRSAWVASFSDTILALHTWRGQAVAGGRFTSINLRRCPRIAIQSQTEWTAPGGGLNGDVSTLATFRGDLVAGGSFTADGGDHVPLARIGRWDGEAWSSIGAGLPRSVTAVTPFRGGLAAACAAPGELSPGQTGFDPVSPAHGSVHWFDGITWNQLGREFNGALRDLAVFHGRLLVAGDFTTGDGRGGVAYWDGGRWVELGGGLDGSGCALQADQDTLWIGGRFTQAGSSISARLAGWIEPTAALEEFRFEVTARSLETGDGAADTTMLDACTSPPRIARLAWRNPRHPEFAKAVLRTSPSDFPLDPEDGDPLWPLSDGSIPGAPGAEMSFELAATHAETLYCSAFAIDHAGRPARPARVRLSLSDLTPPRLEFRLRRLPSGQAGMARFAVEARCGETPAPPGLIVYSGLDLAPLARSTEDPGLWTAIISRPMPARGEPIRVTARDSTGNLAVATLRWSATRVDARTDGRCLLSDNTWISVPRQAVADSAWLTIAGLPDSLRSAAGPVGEWEIAVDQPLLRPLLLVDRPSDPARSPIDLARLALEFEDDPPLPGRYDLPSGFISFPIERSGTCRLVSTDRPASTVADRHRLRVEGPYPNPARRDFTVRWESEARQETSIDLSDVSGRRVARVFAGLSGPGWETLTWVPPPDLPAGVYFGRLRGEGAEQRLRIVWQP